MKKVLASATVAAILAAGCAKEPAVVGEIGSGQTITITASRAVDSRIAVSDDNTILWQEDDVLGVYLGESSSNKKFLLKSGAGSTAAAFESSNTSLPNAPCNVYAYCPYAVADVPTPVAVPFNLKTQTYGALGEYWLMAGTAENVGFPSETTFAMQMHNMMSAIRVKITNCNKTELAISQLEIYTASAGDKTFISSGTIDISDPDFAITPTAYTHKVSLELNESVTIPAGETRIFPIVVAPTDGLDGKKFYIKYKFDGDTEPSVDTKQGRSIARNKFIDIPINIGTITITVPENAASVEKANEALANGSTDVVITEAPTSNQILIIPHNYTTSEAAVSVKLPAISNDVALTIAYGDDAEGYAPENITISTDNNATVGNLIIEAPESTVTVDGKYVNITASTAENTLVVSDRTTVESVTVRKGNVEVYGLIASIDRTASPESKVHFNVNTVEKWNRAVGCSAASTITVAGNLDLKLTSDIVTAAANEIAQIIIDKGVTVNLDLAGHCIESKNDGVSIWNYGTLTIGDTVGGGAIFNSQTDHCGEGANYMHDAVRNAGTLTIDGGRFGDPDADTENENLIHRGAALRALTGSVTIINGGSFTAGDNGFKWNGQSGYTYAIRNSGEMTINDAELYGKMNGGIAGEENGVTYIKGGNYTVSGTKSYYVLVTTANAQIHVSGGTFTSLNSLYGGLLGGFKGMPSWDASDNLEDNGYYITGGTFIKNGETVVL